MSHGQNFFGPFRLIRLVRAGNSCQIWEAANDLENRRVALKVLQKEFRHNREELGYLKHEFEVAKDFKHKNVIEVYQYTDQYDLPLLALEFFKGQNLKQAIRSDHSIILANINNIIEQAAEGLAYFHKANWVHRDIKPDNYLINDDGLVKLIDFAIAQREASGLGKWFSFGAKIQGTRSYMSPEQIRGKGITFRSDIYSFGCSVFEMLTGKLPFTGTNENELLNKHMRSPPPSAAAYNKDVSPEMSELLLKMLAKDPEKRPSSMLKFLQDFRKIRVFRAKKA